MSPIRRTSWALGLAAVLLACATPEPLPPVAHPLVDRVWDVTREATTSPEALLGRLDRATFVLLGEVHDNPIHHALQARVIRTLASQEARSAVVFEMIDRSQGPALRVYLAGDAPTAEGVRAVVGWDESGWPDWSLYAPVFEAALAADLPIVPGDLDPETLQALRTGDLAPEQGARLGLAEPLPPDVLAEMTRTIRESHCGVPIEDEIVARMILTQRARDASLAGALFEAPAADGPGPAAILIAGLEHVRWDRGAPHALARLAPGEDIVSVGFVEVREGAFDAGDDLALRYGGPAPFDYVWFTKRTERPDPCEQYREALEKLGQSPE